VSTHASAHAPRLERKTSDSHPLAGVVAVLLGILVAVLGFFALFTWLDARSARDAADRAAAKATPTASADMGALKSYAGAAPANADALAAAHKAYPATLPAAPAGPVADVHLVLKDVTVQIAPGIEYSA
jgi:hypothetical protein